VPGNTVQFNAQGIFGFSSTTKNPTFHDITNDTTTSWSTIAATAEFPGAISYTGSDGLFIGVTAGCTYFTVSNAGFLQSVVVAVNPIATPCPTPPGLPAAASRAGSTEPSP
jgi:hypothetical protein